MTTTITIDGNARFCEDECPDKIQRMPDEGYGEWSRYPYELNMTNRNFNTFWVSLGLIVSEHGNGLEKAETVLSALQGYDEQLGMRDTEIETGGRGFSWVDCGISLDQVKRYVGSLGEIAKEARLRGRIVIWF